MTTTIPTNEKLFDDGETIDNAFLRAKNYIQDINNKFKTKTIITVSH